MKKQVNGNGKINNTQRKILAKLAVEVLDKKVQQARDESGELVAQIREKVKEELGIIAIDLEIKQMEERIQVLRQKKEELGLSKYNDDAFVPGSKARMLLDKRTGTACERVNELEEMKTDVISRIWTSTTMPEALAVLGEAKKL
jgi:hypothetical protein